MNSKIFGIRPPEGNLIWRNMKSLGEARYFGTGESQPRTLSRRSGSEIEPEKPKSEKKIEMKSTEDRGSIMLETKKNLPNKFASEEGSMTQPVVSGSYSGTSKQAVLEVINSIDNMNKHINDCMESQMRDQPDRTIKLMDPERANTVIEAAKAGLIGLKLKLDASRMLREYEHGDK